MIKKISVVAIFILSAASAYAYAIPSSGSSPSAPASVGNYTFNGSFQSLVSPFEGFIKNLQWTNSTPIDLNVTPTTLPQLNIGPDLQNILGQWLAEFNNWIHQSTGIDLSGILVVILNVILWTLNLAQSVVSWLLGLFH